MEQVDIRLNTVVDGGSFRGADALDDKINRIRDNLNSVGTSGQKAFGKMSQPLGRITGQATEFESSLKASNARVIAFGASVAVINKLSQAFSALVENTIKVEATFAKINTILGQNDQAIKKFGQEIFRVAKDTGTSFEEVSEGALELARQGLSTSETISRISTALKLVKITGIEAEKAVGGLTAAIKGFEGAGLTVVQIADKLSEADVNFAVSTNDLIDGLQRSAASARAAGVSFDELLASITVVQERTQRGGAVIGNAFKTIFSYIARPETLNYLEALGIQVVDSDGKLRAAMPILKDFAREMNRIGINSEAASIAIQKVAGTRQRDILLNLVEDLISSQSQYGKVIAAVGQSAGSVDRKMQKLNDTLELQLNALRNSSKEFASDIGLTAFADGAIDLIKTLTKITDFLDDLTKKSEKFQAVLGALGEVVMGPGLVGAIAIFGKLFIDLVKFSRDSLQSLMGINKEKAQTADLEKSIYSALMNSEKAYNEILNSGLNRVEQEEALKRLLNDQLTIITKMKDVSRAIAPGLYGSGFRVKEGNITKEVPKGTAASGYIAKEARDVSMGVGGASPSSKIVSIPNFSFGGGKRGTMIANTSEYFVPNYANGGDAIFNQNMVRSMGLPSGAIKLSAAVGYPDPKIFPELYRASGIPGAMSSRGAASPLAGSPGYMSSNVGGKAIIAGDYATQRDQDFIIYLKKSYNLTDKEIADLSPLQYARLRRDYQTKNIGERTQKSTDRLNKYGFVFPAFKNAPITVGYINLIDKKENSPEVNSAAIYTVPLETELNDSLWEKSRTSLVSNAKEYFQKFSNLGTVISNEHALRAIEQNIDKKTIEATFGSIFESAVVGSMGIKNRSGSSWDINRNQIPLLKKLIENNKFFVKRADSGIVGELLAADVKNALNTDNLSKEMKKKIMNNPTGMGSRGYIPNFADPLSDAIKREQASGVPINQIRINQSGKLRNAQNPMGLAVTNTRDEPTGAIPNYAKKKLTEAQILAGFGGTEARERLQAKILQSQEDLSKALRDLLAALNKPSKTGKNVEAVLRRKALGGIDAEQAIAMAKEKGFLTPKNYFYAGQGNEQQAIRNLENAREKRYLEKIPLSVSPTKQRQKSMYEQALGEQSKFFQKWANDLFLSYKNNFLDPMEKASKTLYLPFAGSGAGVVKGAVQNTPLLMLEAPAISREEILKQRMDFYNDPNSVEYMKREAAARRGREYTPSQVRETPEVIYLGKNQKYQAGELTKKFEKMSQSVEKFIGVSFALTMATSALQGAFRDTESKLLKFVLEFTDSAANAAFMFSALIPAASGFSDKLLSWANSLSDYSDSLKESALAAAKEAAASTASASADSKEALASNAATGADAREAVASSAATAADTREAAASTIAAAASMRGGMMSGIGGAVTGFGASAIAGMAAAAPYVAIIGAVGLAFAPLIMELTKTVNKFEELNKKLGELDLGALSGRQGANIGETRAINEARLGELRKAAAIFEQDRRDRSSSIMSISGLRKEGESTQEFIERRTAEEANMIAEGSKAENLVKKNIQLFSSAYAILGEELYKNLITEAKISINEQMTIAVGGASVRTGAIVDAIDMEKLRLLIPRYLNQQIIELENSLKQEEKDLQNNGKIFASKFSQMISQAYDEVVFQRDLKKLGIEEKVDEDGKYTYQLNSAGKGQLNLERQLALGKFTPDRALEIEQSIETENLRASNRTKLLRDEQKIIEDTISLVTKRTALDKENAEKIAQMVRLGADFSDIQTEVNSLIQSSPILFGSALEGFTEDVKAIEDGDKRILELNNKILSATQGRISLSNDEIDGFSKRLLIAQDEGNLKEVALEIEKDLIELATKRNELGNDDLQNLRNRLQSLYRQIGASEEELRVKQETTKELLKQQQLESKILNSISRSYESRIFESNLETLGLKRAEGGGYRETGTQVARTTGFSAYKDGVYNMPAFEVVAGKENILQLERELALTALTAEERMDIEHSIARLNQEQSNRAQLLKAEAEILSQSVRLIMDRTMLEEKEATKIAKMIKGEKTVAEIQTEMMGILKKDPINISDDLQNYVKGLDDPTNAQNLELIQQKIVKLVADRVELTNEESRGLAEQLINAATRGTLEAESLKVNEKIQKIQFDKIALTDEEIQQIQEKYNLESDELQKLLDLLRIRQEIEKKSLQPKSFQDSLDQALKDIGNGRRGVAYFAENLAKSSATTFENSMNTALNNLATGAYDSLDSVFGQIALDFGNMLLQEINRAVAAELTKAIFGTSFMKGSMGFMSGLFGGKAAGGYISGGSGVKDDVPTMLMGGEYVVKKAAVQKYGVNFLESLNQGQVQGYAAGGEVLQGGGNYYRDFWSNSKSNMMGGEASNARLARAKQTDFFMPGYRGAGAIIGKENLLAFAMQGTTSGATDTFSRRGTGFSFDTELQSRNLSGRGRIRAMESPIGQGLMSAKQQAFDLYTQRISEEQRVVQAKKDAEQARSETFKKAVIGAAINSVAAGVAGSLNKPTTYQNFDAFSPRAIFQPGASGLGDSVSLPLSAQELSNQIFGGFLGPGGANGGYFPSVRKFANGGSANAMLMGGEYIMSPQATSGIGRTMLDDINNMRYPMPVFANGGARGAAPMKSGSSGADIGELNININIEKSGNASVDSSMSSDSSGDAQQSKEFAKKIKDVVVKVIQEEKRVSGSLFTRNK